MAARPPAAAGTYAENRILVRFAEAKGSRAAALARVPAGARIARSYQRIPGLHAIELPAGVTVADALDAYRGDRKVLYAEPDFLVSALAIPNDLDFDDLYGLHNTGQTGGTPDADIDAVEAWEITTGSSSVVVAVLDTGIDATHPDLAANVFHNTVECTPNGIDDDFNGFVDDCFGVDFVDDDPDPTDEAEHGTHVSGTIGAVGNNNLGVVGVNHAVKILGCRFLDETGSGVVSDAIACLDYVGQMKQLGHDIVATNNSWGSGGLSAALVDAVEQQAQLGILFVVAAGNSGVEAGGMPTGLFSSNVIAVAATNSADNLAGFSSFHARGVHLAAPGVSVLSTIPGGSYQHFSGTSMATPHVAGVAALVHAAQPSLQAHELRNVILTSVDALPATADKTLTGGRLNAHAALTCSNRLLSKRVHPLPNTVHTRAGASVGLAAINVNCAAPAGNVGVQIEPGSQTVTLLDDGAGFDALAGDGVYSAEWIPSAPATHTITFPGGDVLTADVGNTYPNPTGAPDTQFGYAIDVDNERLAIGTIQAPAGGTVYLIDTETGVTLDSFDNPNPPPPGNESAYFGNSVSLAGDLLAIGAELDSQDALYSGRAYLFDTSTGSLLHEFANPNPQEGAFFGHDVALVGENVAVSAYLDSTMGLAAGAVHLFDSATGALLDSFYDVDPDDLELFGLALLADGTTLYVAVPQNATGVPDEVLGVVRAINADPNDLGFGSVVRSYVAPSITKPFAPSQPFGPFNATFGFALEVVGDRLFVGDPLASIPVSRSVEEDGRLEVGGVFVYDVATATLENMISNPKPTFPFPGFGSSIAAGDRQMIIGASGDSRVGINAGVAYVLDVGGPDFADLLLSPSGASEGFFGFASAAEGSALFTGAPILANFAPRDGAVFRFDEARRDTLKCHKGRLESGAFTPQNVSIADELRSTTVTVLGPATVCTAAAKIDPTIVNPGTGSVCYRIEDSGPSVDGLTLDTLLPQREATFVFDRPHSLCLPATLDGGPASSHNAFACYRGKALGTKLARFEGHYVDAFGTRTLKVVKLSAFCVPVDVDGGGVADPDDYRACYKAKPSHEPSIDTVVDASDALGSISFEVSKESEVCAPARRLQ